MARMRLKRTKRPSAPLASDCLSHELSRIVCARHSRRRLILGEEEPLPDIPEPQRAPYVSPTLVQVLPPADVEPAMSAMMPQPAASALRPPQLSQQPLQPPQQMQPPQPPPPVEPTEDLRTPLGLQPQPTSHPQPVSSLRETKSAELSPLQQPHGAESSPRMPHSDADSGVGQHALTTNQDAGESSGSEHAVRIGDIMEQASVRVVAISSVELEPARPTACPLHGARSSEMRILSQVARLEEQGMLVEASSLMASQIMSTAN